MDILHAIKWKKANWICCILRRNFRPKHVIDGKIEGKRGRGRKRKHQEKTKKKSRCWNFQEETLDRNVWRTRFGRCYGPVLCDIGIKNDGMGWARGSYGGGRSSWTLLGNLSERDRLENPRIPGAIILKWSSINVLWESVGFVWLRTSVGLLWQW
jgi:hypothetical protein